MIKKVINRKQAGQLIRDFAQEEVKLSQRALKKLKKTPGGIVVNGLEQTVRYELKEGDVLSFHFPDERTDTSIQAEEMDLDIIYEDDAVMVINKAAGRPTIPSRTHPSGTIANGLLHYYEKKQLPYTVHIVTRLDKDTSGLLLIAKHRHAHHLLSKQLQKGGIIRAYEAILHGQLPTDAGLIDAPIGRQDDSIIAREVRADGQKARTHYEVMKRTKDYTCVRAQLETGRTHQIRVHFAYLGNPLAGDDLYGGSLAVIPRQALHAYRLQFKHPLTGENLAFDQEAPLDMQMLIK